MVHGDCSSRGCYAMTDEQIAEIYSLGRESFFGGQRAFQLQAYPFKMTPVNMAKHRNNPNMPFWKMIKQGYDHFEVTRQEPKVDFCEKKYVFDAIRAPNAKRDPVFDASAKCPAYAIPDEIADAVREKQQQEAAETAKLISKGTPVARLNTGIDGGMHKVFAAKLPEASTGLSEGGDGQGLSLAVAVPRARHHSRPTSIRRARHPCHPLGRAAEPKPAGGASAHGCRAARPTRVASAAPAAAIRRMVLQPRPQGRHRRQRKPPRAPPSAAAARAREAESHRSQAHRAGAASEAAAPKAAAPKPAEPKQAAARPPLKPSLSDTPAPPLPAPAQVAGSAPIVPSNSFDSRFGAMK